MPSLTPERCPECGLLTGPGHDEECYPRTPGTCWSCFRVVDELYYIGHGLRGYCSQCVELVEEGYAQS
jgi:hypothetical protein